MKDILIAFGIVILAAGLWVVYGYIQILVLNFLFRRVFNSFKNCELSITIETKGDFAIALMMGPIVTLCLISGILFYYIGKVVDKVQIRDFAINFGKKKEKK